mmetsp:Transcript_137791/g.349104  ORF Transcript_137791/g.349104 Transcript_137791/m.349104 type:complete len:200 (+) Transcript_137791:57-656(+)
MASACFSAIPMLSLALPRRLLVLLLTHWTLQPCWGEEALLQRVGPHLACSGCKLAVQAFRGGVARHVKAKMSAKKREKVFSERFDRVCKEGGPSYPANLAAADEGGKRRFIEKHKMTSKHSNGWAGADVRKDALELCRHFVDGRREELLKAILRSEEARASEIRFERLLCLKPHGLVCEETDVPENEGDDEDDSEDGEL